jgi:acyl transferase domain-containing protein
MGCLMPGARNLAEFWRTLRRGEDGIREVPPTHWSAGDYFDPDPKRPDHTYCTRGGYLSPVAFDPTEFGIPPAILEATDTAQLLSLVVAKAALEDAGYGDDRDFNRERVGVILGITGTQELVIPLAARLGHPLWRRALTEAGVAPDIAEDVIARISDGYVSWQENSFPGLLGNVVAGRIANRLNLRGTNCVVDAACASSMGAVHLAMMELATGRCDMALTGGADTLNDIFMHMCFSKTPALSPTGDARPFDDLG